MCKYWTSSAFEKQDRIRDALCCRRVWGVVSIVRTFKPTEAEAITPVGITAWVEGDCAVVCHANILTRYFLASVHTRGSRAATAAGGGWPQNKRECLFSLRPWGSVQPAAWRLLGHLEL